MCFEEAIERRSDQAIEGREAMQQACLIIPGRRGLDRAPRSLDRSVASSTLCAFSLVEIMVVLVIIGLLAGVVTINVRGHLIRARQNAARMEIATVCDALDTYYSLNSRYPSNDEGLVALTKVTSKDPEPLLKQVPVDPWGNPYAYNQPGRNGPYEVISLGADGREGGEGADADICSWDLKDRRRATANQ
jgi:general secretion pathway protein G